MSAAIDSVFIVNMNGTFLGVALTMERAQAACDKVNDQAGEALGWDEISPLEWIVYDEPMDIPASVYAVSKNNVFAIWESVLL